MTTVATAVTISAAMVAFGDDLRRFVQWVINSIKDQTLKRLVDEVVITYKTHPMMMYRLYRFINDQYAERQRITENKYEYSQKQESGVAVDDYELPLNTWYAVKFVEGTKHAVSTYTIHCYFESEKRARVLLVHRPVFGDRSFYAGVLRRFVTHVQRRTIDSDACLEKYILHVNPKTGRPEWVFQRTKKTRVSPAFFTPEMKRVVEMIKKFESASNRSTYALAGMPLYKCFLLHGVPGTGKSTIAEAVAAHYNKRVYLVELSVEGLTDANLVEAMGEIKENALIAFEELDKVGVFTNNAAGVSTNGFLRALSGGFSRIPDYSYVFATANSLEAVSSNFSDDALFRKGRFEEVIQFTTPFDPISTLLLK